MCLSYRASCECLALQNVYRDKTHGLPQFKSLTTQTRLPPGVGTRLLPTCPWLSPAVLCHGVDPSGSYCNTDNTEISNTCHKNHLCERPSGYKDHTLENLFYVTNPVQ